jgi:putative membrane-bound dehydrogenase-like protein
MFWKRFCGLALLALPLPFAPVSAQSEHGFINTRPSGQPYLSPEESRRRFQVPDGFEVKVFAAEPDIINPISFTVDERGRLWVVECYEYPNRTPPGKKPRDRIKLLEDTTGAGRADKVTVWAEGKDLPRFDLASGIEVGHGGVFLGAAPYLFFLRDTKGAGHCDKCDILLSGFHSEDTHEVLNTLQWGPDCRLYGLHGIFTQSKIGDIQMNAAVWRYDVDHKHFDIFAEGTSNPWGLDFDAHGQAFLTACVIPHAFHIIPGGTYIRQAGNSQNPYAYGLLHEISDHLHHKESGWAHAGALVIQSDSFPPEYQGSLLMGSIHGCSIKRDILGRRGSSFVAHHGPDFLVSGDKNFRPINLRWAPDGSIYVIDWHDQNPCHQAAPDSWDMTHGRIYKIQRKGLHSMPPGDLAKKSGPELVELLTNDNPWWYRTALRLLGERRDQSVAPLLEELLFQSKNDAHSLRGLWGLYAVGAFDEALAEKALRHESPWVRSWTVRLLGEAGRVSVAMLERLVQLAEQETAPEVRLQLASTAGRFTQQDTSLLLHNLMRHTEDVHDPCIPLMIWLAYEPRVAAGHEVSLSWLREHAEGNALITEEIVPRTLRRLTATGKAEDMAAAVAFLGGVRESEVRRRGLEGLLLGLQTRQTDQPPGAWPTVYATLVKDPDREVQRLARRLAVRFHDQRAIHQALTIAQDTHKPAAERTEALHDLADAHPADALPRLEMLLVHDPSVEVRCEVCRTLAAYSDPQVSRAVLSGWKDYPPAVRVEAVNLLAGRREWAHTLLAAVGRNEVPRTGLNNNTILRIRALRDARLNSQIEAVWGRVREGTPAELNALIEQMRASLTEGRGSFERGRTVFENQCSKCHKFDGKGHDVGPALDGAARDIEYLLINILDPNRVVGQPYYTRYVVLKNGRIETGLLHAEDKESITLKTENDALKVLLKKDIEEMAVQEKSLMPEGLNKNMSKQDFRDLIRYVMAHPFLTDVAVAGPYAGKDAPKVVATDPVHTLRAVWNWPVVGPSGRIALPAVKGDGESVAYVAAEVTAPSAMRTRLQLGSASPLQVWVNGQSVYKGRPGSSSAAPDQAGTDVQLVAGVNRLLFEVKYQGGKDALYARLLDPQRKLKHPEGRN